MNELVKALPSESLFHHYLAARAIMETPVSYDLLCAMTCFALALKRDVWVSQRRWKVYPVFSPMLVGPSGTGKNTAIGGLTSLCTKLNIPVVSGGTIEALVDQVAKCGRPATCLIHAEEIADMIGKKDYQQGIVQGITDLLDTKDVKDISLKSTGPRRIYEPTVSFACGSTAGWLHSGLPKDAQTGGFYGRFVVSVEEGPKREVPLLNMLPESELVASDQGEQTFLEGLPAAVETVKGYGEISLSPGSVRMYDSWYRARHKNFSSLAQDYATRFRDHVLRLSALSAISCFRQEIGEIDMGFGIAVANHISKTIDSVVAQASPEWELAQKILRGLPQTEKEIIWNFSRGYGPRLIREALALLRDSGKVRFDHVSGVLVKVSD